jgi:WD40 repeat protein
MEAAAAYVGITGVVGIVDVAIKTFEHAKNALQARRKISDAIGTIVDICGHVKKLLNDNHAFPFPKLIIDRVASAVTVVRDIAEKVENQTLGGRIRHMPKALGRLNELDKVENQMQTVLDLIAATVAGEAFAKNTECTVEMLEKQQRSLAQVLFSIGTTSTRIETAVSDVEQVCGPLADLALDDKVEEILQRFDRIDESMRGIHSDVKTIFPSMECMRNDIHNIMLRLPAPAETTLRDSWVCNFSSVPSPPSYAVETQYVRNLYSALLDETGRNRVIAVHGWGGAGKTTACKMVANGANVRQRFKDGIFWVELGETASTAALIERLARAVERSGGEKTSEYIIRQLDAGKFDLAKEEFHNWFAKREVLFVLDNIWDSKDRDLNRWVDVIRQIPGSESHLLCSSRIPLGEKNIEFSRLSGKEQTTIFLRHLQLQRDSSEYLDNIEFAQAIVEDCAGLPLALAMAAGYLRRETRGWKSLYGRVRNEITVEDKPMFGVSEHACLASVFETSLEWIGREMAPIQNCSLSWAELYTSLCVMDPASPGLPLCVLSLMWGMSAESAQEVCQTFVSLSLATLSAGNLQSRVVHLHDLQRQYCVQQCARDRTPSLNSARSFVPERAWHKRIIEGLVAKAAAAKAITDDPVVGSFVVGSVTAFAALQARATTVADVVEAFMGLAEGSVLKEYLIKNLGRHICGYEEGLLVLAKGVLSDYRLLLDIACHQSLSIAAHQYYLVANRMSEWSENHDGSKGNDGGMEFGQSFIRDLEKIGDILRVCVPPAAVELPDNGEEGSCLVHGKRSVGDPGLAHQLVGRLRVASREYLSLVLEAGGGHGDGGTGGRSVVDMLVGSIKRCSSGPWLVPVNRGYFEADPRGLAVVIRERAQCCLSVVLGNVECVAFAGREAIRVCILDSGDVIRELYDIGAEEINCLAVTDGGCGMKPADVDAVGLDKVVWLAAGYRDGSVRIWDLEMGRCIATLHPTFGYRCFYFSHVFMAPDRRRVVHLTKPVFWDEAGLHVWDLSPDGTQERYEYVHGCKSRFESEIWSAELLCRNLKCSEEVHGSRAVRFEQSIVRFERNVVRFGRYQAQMKRKRFDESRRMMCCLVANCEDGVWVVTVNGDTGDVTVVDALTSMVIIEHRFTDNYSILSVAAFQREDSRVSVVTGHERGMIRMRMADSGELIGQWQASLECVMGVAIAVKAGKVMGAYSDGCSDGGLWIWSFGIDRAGPVQSNNSASAGAVLPQAPEALNVPKHWGWINSIAFSGDGKLAAACSYEERFVLVWDTATGSALRRLDINEEGWTRPREVAISSEGDWILCASFMDADGKNAFLNLWGPFNQEFAARFKPTIKTRGCCCVTINTSQDRPNGIILCGSEEDGYETFEWVLSCCSYLDITSPTAASEDVVSEFKQTQKGSRDLLVQRDGIYKLHVGNAALGGVARCTCKAAAVFDCNITCMSAWSEATALPDASASTPPKVAVGFDDGTVHFMELCWNNV